MITVIAIKVKLTAEMRSKIIIVFMRHITYILHLKSGKKHSSGKNTY